MSRERLERGLYRYEAQAGTVTYMIDVQVEGRRIQKTLPVGMTRDKARKYLGKIRNEMNEQALFPELTQKRKERNRKSVRFKDFAEIYLREKEAVLKDMDTRRRQVKLLRERYFGGKWLHLIGPSEIRGMITDLKRRKSGPVTVSKYLSCLRDMLNIAVELDMLESNPAEAIRGPRIPQNVRLTYLRPEECWTLIQALRDLKQEWLAVLVEMYIRTGCRKAELTGLTWDAVTLEPLSSMPYGSIIIEAEREKNGKGRTIPLDSRSRKLLLTQRKRYPAGLVFRNRRGLKVGDFRKTLDNAIEKAKLDTSLPRLSQITAHSFRHTWATNCSNAGVPLRVLQKLGGWKDLKMVERYAKAGEEEQAAGIFRMDEYLDSARDKSVTSENTVDFPLAVGY